MAESSGIARDFSDVSSSDSDTLTESDTETENETDSSYSESDCEEDVQVNLHNLDITNSDSSTEKNDDWIQVLDRDVDQDNSPLVFSPVNPPGPVNCIPEDSLPHEYFLHMIGKDFVDLLVKGTNTYGDNKIQAKGTIPKSSRFHKSCHTNREELLAFLAVVINMGLIRKSCLKDYWNLKDWWSQNTPFFPAIFTRDRALLHASVYVTFSGK